MVLFFTASKSALRLGISAMTVELTRDAVVSIIGGNVNLKPLMQVIDINPVKIPHLPVSYRLLVSDGVWSHPAVVTFLLNDLFNLQSVRKGSIVRLTDYVCSEVIDHKLIVVMNMETIVPDSMLIGNPREYVQSDTTAQTALPKNNFQQSARGNIDEIHRDN